MIRASTDPTLLASGDGPAVAGSTHSHGTPVAALLNASSNPDVDSDFTTCSRSSHLVQDRCGKRATSRRRRTFSPHRMKLAAH